MTLMMRRGVFLQFVRYSLIRKNASDDEAHLRALEAHAVLDAVADGAAWCIGARVQDCLDREYGADRHNAETFAEAPDLPS